MSIKVYLYSSYLAYIAKGKHLFDVNGKTVGECLNHLVNLFPEMKEALFAKTGRVLAKKGVLHPYIKVLVNKESAGTESMARKVKDGDVIYILMGSG
jgi:molybdopterin converting factor small subunit